MFSIRIKKIFLNNSFNNFKKTFSKPFCGNRDGTSDIRYCGAVLSYNKENTNTVTLPLAISVRGQNTNYIKTIINI